MNIGLDYYQTITTYPEWFHNLCSSLKSEGHSIYILTAVSDATEPNKYINSLREYIGRNQLHVDGIKLIYFKYKSMVPHLKYEACKELNIHVMFDDRGDVCKYLADKGIAAFKSVQPAQSPSASEDQYPHQE